MISSCLKKRLITKALYTFVFLTGCHAIQAHIVMEPSSLRLQTQKAERVARAKIIDPEVILNKKTEKKHSRTRCVSAEILETLKGTLPQQQICFYQQAHGIASYKSDEEVILFLHSVNSIRELANTPINDQIEWVSKQTSSTKYAINHNNREAVSKAIHAYVRNESLDAAEKPEDLRTITIKMLNSSHEALAISALHDLVRGRDKLSLSKNDLPTLIQIIEDNSKPISLRIGLLTELEIRQLLDAAPLWAELLKTTKGSDQLAVIRASATHPSEAVMDELLKLIQNKNKQVTMATAISLGGQRSELAVPALNTLLAHNEQSVRMAAIRGLGKIGSNKAFSALNHAAGKHDDPATRRRAAAEVRILEQATKK